MANSIENYKDLSDLGIDVNESNDPITQSFVKAARHLPKILPLDNQTLLTLYSFYKQGTEGPCKTPKPSWYDVRSKSKWDAWNRLGCMPQNEAKQLYIDTIKRLDPLFAGSLTEDSKTEYWTKVSSMVDENAIPFSDMTIVDYIKDGNTEQVQRFLKSNYAIIKNLFSKLDEEGLGLIHWAADSGFQQILSLLLDSGADINLLDADGQTALHYASSCSHTECVKFLVAKGAKTDILDNTGSSPAAVASDVEVKEMLNK